LGLSPDQVWRQLPAGREEALSARLAQMIARQIEALPSPPLTHKEESDE